MQGDDVARTLAEIKAATEELRRLEERIARTTADRRAVMRDRAMKPTRTRRQA